MVLIWIFGAILVGGLLYLVLPMIAMMVLMGLRILFYVILFCIAIRVIIFLPFLIMHFFQTP
jgi:hypothetical protein